MSQFFRNISSSPTLLYKWGARNQLSLADLAGPIRFERTTPKAQSTPIIDDLRFTLRLPADSFCGVTAKC